jgi:hypothetical protein
LNKVSSTHSEALQQEPKPIAKAIVLHYNHYVLYTKLTSVRDNVARWLKTFFCVFILAALVGIMMASASHADHDHHDDPDPSHSVCDICIVANSEDSGQSFDTDKPRPDFDSSGPPSCKAEPSLAFACAGTASQFSDLRLGQALPRNADIGPDPARAPPL